MYNISNEGPVFGCFIIVYFNLCHSLKKKKKQKEKERESREANTSRIHL